MAIILGIDPGSRCTGYGLIRSEACKLVHLSSGCIILEDMPFPERLGKIFDVLKALLAQYAPNEVAVEQVFSYINPGAALKLGQARGAAIAAVAGLSVSEYSARRVKQAVVGYGAASKQQVQHMVGVLLGLANPLQVDAADALALAICHAQSSLPIGLTQLMQSGGDQPIRFRRGRLR